VDGNESFSRHDAAIKKQKVIQMKYLIIILSLILFLAGCRNRNGERQAASPAVGNVITFTDAQMKNAGIEVGNIDQKAISSMLKVNGRIDVPPQNMVSVSVPLGGYLKSTKLLPGMHVKKNQVIAVIEDNQYIQLQQDYLTAKAQFGFHESEYRRQKELNESKASSDKVFEQAKSIYQTQKILIRSLAQKIRLINIDPNRLNEDNISRSINIYSPINGFVSAVNVNIGKYITPGEVCFELVNPADIHLNLKIFEKDLSRIFIGQKVIAYTNNNPDIKYSGSITLISRNVAEDGRTDIHCHFDNYNKSLFPGMYMNAEIELNGNIQSVVKDEAVVRFEGKEYIFRNSGINTFEMTEVKTGEAEDGFTGIISTSDLAGKPVVTKGAYSLLMSLKNKEAE
jgi:membrane fusion protein, heavy metal efflux system